MRAGQNQHVPLTSFEARCEIEEKHAHLSNNQRAAVEQILSSRDQITALEGVAGTGKTTSLAAIREAAEREGYQVQGLAPTSRAAHQLNDAGIESSTLQHHLASGEQDRDGQKRLYILDESSLASTKQVNQFLHGLHDQDRVLMVGDVRQHEAVEAGRPYQQLQEAGMQTARLDEMVRQKDPALKEAVGQLARGEVREAIGNLDRQGRVHEIADREQRMDEIARQYATRPENTLVVSPDNLSRVEINERIHRAMQNTGRVSEEEHKLPVLTARQELTGADRQWAVQYEVGDVVRYARGSKSQRIEPGEYARVSTVDRDQNLITIQRSNGERQSYDPRRLSGVTVYHENQRVFSEGDRVQFTAPSKELHVANRQLGRVENIDASGDIRIRTDSGRRVEFIVKEWPHIDHGYAAGGFSAPSRRRVADGSVPHAKLKGPPIHATVSGRQVFVAQEIGDFAWEFIDIASGKYGDRKPSSRRSLRGHHGGELSLTTQVPGRREYGCRDTRGSRSGAR